MVIESAVIAKFTTDLLVAVVKHYVKDDITAAAGVSVINLLRDRVIGASQKPGAFQMQVFLDRFNKDLQRALGKEELELGDWDAAALAVGELINQLLSEKDLPVDPQLDHAALTRILLGRENKATEGFGHGTDVAELYRRMIGELATVLGETIDTLPNYQTAVNRELQP
jgi:hypothetical protein